MENQEKKIMKWLVDGEVGLSSKTMASIALGYEDSELNWPRDPSDFRRCYLFLSKCIDWRNHKGLLDKLASLSKEWRAIRDNWAELLDLYHEEREKKRSPKLYQKMKEIGL